MYYSMTCLDAIIMILAHPTMPCIYLVIIQHEQMSIPKSLSKISNLVIFATCMITTIPIYISICFAKYKMCIHIHLCIYITMYIHTYVLTKATTHSQVILNSFIHTCT